jgi:hypothetical protein
MKHKIEATVRNFKSEPKIMSSKETYYCSCYTRRMNSPWGAI